MAHSKRIPAHLIASDRQPAANKPHSSRVIASGRQSPLMDAGSFALAAASSPWPAIAEAERKAERLEKTNRDLGSFKRLVARLMGRGGRP